MVVVIMGVSGAGKTTVGRALAAAIGAPFRDADDDHPRANLEKMRSGVPLSEDDRLPWLEILRGRIDVWLASGQTAVLACSALSELSRARLGAERSGIELVYLRASQALIEARMRARAHFMPVELAASQLAALEPPRDALELDAARSPDELVAEIRAHCEL